jgi:hypothetical protein
MKKNEHDDLPLKQLLHDWKINEPLPPRFQEKVWRRIEKGEAVARERTWLDWLRIAIARPAYATVCAALLLVAGSAAGFWQASQDSARIEKELAQRYVAAVDPYAR